MMDDINNTEGTEGAQKLEEGIQELLNAINEDKENTITTKIDFKLSNNKMASHYIIKSSGAAKKGTKVLAHPDLNKMAIDKLNSLDKAMILRCAVALGQSSVFNYNIKADVESLETQFLHTGMYSFDVGLTQNPLAKGGIPRGAISLTYGRQGSGKSSLGINICSIGIKQGLSVAWIDVEQSLDPNLLRSWGINPDEFKYSVYRPANNEAYTIFNLYKALVRMGTDIIILDSITAINMFRSEDVNVVAQEQMGMVAKTMGQFLKQIVWDVKQHNTVAFFISQIRSTLDQYKPDTYPGGAAWGHYSSLIFKQVKICDFIIYNGVAIPSKSVDKNIKSILTSIGKVELSNMPVVGIQGVITVEKSRYSAVKGTYPWEYFFDKGFETTLQVAIDLEKYNIITRSGHGIKLLHETELDKKKEPVVLETWKSKGAFKNSMIENPDKYMQLLVRLEKAQKEEKINYKVNLDILEASNTATKNYDSDSGKTKMQILEERKNIAIESGNTNSAELNAIMMEVEAQQNQDTTYIDKKTKERKTRPNQFTVTKEEAETFDNAEIDPENVLSEDGEF